MKVLVTGGAGFIGSHCVDRLLEERNEVVVLDLKTKEEAKENLGHCLESIEYISGDIRNLSLLKELAVDCNAILHLAAVVSVPASIADPVESFTTNVLGTHYVFEAARLSGQLPVVYASSAAVYGDVDQVPTPESATLRPLSPYGLHKKHNEEYAAMYATQYGVPSVGLRFFNVYGERQDPSSPYSGVISIFTDYLKQDKTPTIFGTGEATRDFVYVKDVAKVCVHFLSHFEEGPLLLNVGTGQSLSIQTVYDNLAQAVGSQLKPEYSPARSGDILHSCTDTSLLKKYLIDFTPTLFEDGVLYLIQNTVDFEKK